MPPVEYPYGIRELLVIQPRARLEPIVIQAARLRTDLLKKSGRGKARKKGKGYEKQRLHAEKRRKHADKHGRKGRMQRFKGGKVE
jgi:hypothetical protein